MTQNRDSRIRKGGRGKYIPKRKVCLFCRDKVKLIDYKDMAMLRSYVSDRAKIVPRRKSGACARHQRALATAIKRARHLALLPYVATHVQKTAGIGVRAQQ
jgi:small subunit ribosomal protein S18